MEFTREPVIETVITPKEGCKLVVRSSKNSGQEEYFVDAVEVVSFGHSFFFRSLEKPKAFLVPTSDYEILEVREARMVLKNVGLDRSIKIAGGRDATIRGGKEPIHERVETTAAEGPSQESTIDSQESKPERPERKRDRRRGARRRRGPAGSEGAPGERGDAPVDAEHPELSRPLDIEGGHAALSSGATLTSMLSSLLPPPPTLISETIKRYKDNDLFRGAFFKEEEEAKSEVSLQPEAAEPAPIVPLEQPAYGSFEMSLEEEEAVYKERAKRLHSGEEEKDPEEENSAS